MNSSFYGVPIVSASNVFEVLEGMGIRQWPKRRDPLELSKYLALPDLTDDERSDAERFAPKVQVVSLEDPHGNPYGGFRVTPKDWATTITFFEHEGTTHTLIVGEYKHGLDTITLVPPSGVLDASDRESEAPWLHCALREFEQEIGFRLHSLTRLTDLPLGTSGRNSTQVAHLFYGRLQKPYERGTPSPDVTEKLGIVAIPVPDWIALIKRGQGIEQVSAAITWLGLDKYDEDQHQLGFY